MGARGSQGSPKEALPSTIWYSIILYYTMQVFIHMCVYIHIFYTTHTYIYMIYHISTIIVVILVVILSTAHGRPLGALLQDPLFQLVDACYQAIPKVLEKQGKAPAFLGLFWDPFGPFWTILDHFRTILGPFWDHFGTILGPFWDHFGREGML